MEKMRCNKCGKNLLIKQGIPREDFLYIKKEWGYFSKKDGKYQEFVLCEDCYDRMIEEFVIPPRETEITEFV